jgi:hypothetical protein
LRSVLTCRLCQRQKELVRSHILPELVFKPCYDDKHRARQRVLPTFKREFVQKGWRQRLLCQDCEARFSRYERYFSSIWYGAKTVRPSVAPLPGGLTMHGINYANFKLFHLSILWRMGASALEAFHSVELGPHLERLRKMLLADDPGPASKYPIGAVALINKGSGEFLEGFIVSPHMRRVEGHRVYLLAFGGCMWCYGVSNHDAPWFPNALTEDGSLFILSQQFDEFQEMREFLAMYGKAMSATGEFP